MTNRRQTRNNVLIGSNQDCPPPSTFETHLRIVLFFLIQRRSPFLSLCICYICTDRLECDVIFRHSRGLRRFLVLHGFATSTNKQLSDLHASSPLRIYLLLPRVCTICQMLLPQRPTDAWAAIASGGKAVQIHFCSFMLCRPRHTSRSVFMLWRIHSC